MFKLLKKLTNLNIQLDNKDEDVLYIFIIS